LQVRRVERRRIDDIFLSSRPSLESRIPLDCQGSIKDIAFNGVKKFETSKKRNARLSDQKNFAATAEKVRHD
jgi:hypothetical protein